MNRMRKLHFQKTIRAPREHVWKTMLAPDTYRDWTAAFADGSYYEGRWEKGEQVKFLTPGGEGMLAEIAESRPPEFLSIHHLGEIRKDGGGAARTWEGEAYENYSLAAAGDTTTIRVDMDVVPEYEAYMREVWPKALDRLAAVCER